MPRKPKGFEAFDKLARALVAEAIDSEILKAASNAGREGEG